MPLPSLRQPLAPEADVLTEIDRNHCIDLRAGRLMGLSSAPDVAGLLARIRADPRGGTLVLHFHGGLNSLDDGIERCAAMTPFFLEAGAYPLFFAWESAFGEVLRNQLAALAADTVFGGLAERLDRYLREHLKGAAVRGADNALAGRAEALAALAEGDAETLDIDERARARLFSFKDIDRQRLEDQLANDAELLARVDDWRGADPGARPPLAHTLPHVPADAPANRSAVLLALLAQRAAKAAAGVFARFGRGRDHGLRATIFEEALAALELGKALSVPFALLKRQVADAYGDDTASRGGSAVIEALRAHRAQGWQPRVVLVGHSAGSIHICHFIDRAKAVMPDMKFDVVFMTPGVSTARLAATLESSGDAIANLRSFSLDGAAEAGDPLSDSGLVQALYPRSTLYFAAGVLEYDGGEDAGDRPLAGMQRYFNQPERYDDPATRKVAQYFAAGTGRAVWIPQGGAFGHVAHAGIEDNPVMRAHLADLLRGGFGPR